MNRKTYSSSSTNRMISVYGTIAEESSFEVLMPFVPKEYTVVGKAPPHCLTILFARKRGIKKAAGDANSVNYVQNTYEGYGPNGIAIIVETLTDNKNRTAANVRSAFSKGRGNIGTSGCVSFMFQKKGQIIVSKEEYETDPDEFMMIALDAGAEDFVEEDDSYEITTDPDAFGEVREALEKEGVPMASAEVTMIPDNYVTLTDPEDIKNLNRTLDLLDEDDDVQAVYHNWEEE